MKEGTSVHTFMPGSGFLELTTGCNLRCVYCAVSDPGYVGTVMSDEVFHKIVDLCGRAGLRSLNIAGHGETTMLPDWREKAGYLLDRGFAVHIVTNSAVPFDWDDARTMGRFSQIQFSIDTVDPALLRRLRRKVDLRTFTHNVALVRAACLAHGWPTPALMINCVLSDLSVHGLDRLVALAGSLRCRLNLANLIELHGIADPPPRSLFSLAGQELRNAWLAYTEAMALADRLNVQIGIQPNLKAFLDAAPAHDFEPASNRHSWSKDYHGCRSEYTAVSDPLPSGHTRNCLDPWTTLYFGVNGDILQCCLAGLDVLANVRDVTSLDEVFTSPNATAFRNGLLSGNMRPACANCVGRGTTPIPSLHAEVSRRVSERGR